MLDKHWYLVCPADEIKKNVKQFKINYKNILIFRSEDGKLSAIEDRCCHRNVPLSLGYREKDNMVCPYHGWEFNGHGKCVRIPSLHDNDRIPKAAKIESYPVREFNKWIWLLPVDKDAMPENRLPRIPDIPEMDKWPFTYKSYTFEADLASAAESLIDPYHIAYTHKDSIGTFLGQIDDFPAIFHVDFKKDGIEGYYERTNVGKITEKMYFGNEDKITAFYKFYFPNISKLEARFKKRTLLILEHFYQVDDKNINMMQITLWKNILDKIPFFTKKLMARKSDKIVNEDIRLLVAQKQIKDFQGENYKEVSIKPDTVSLAFRKYWQNQLEKE